MFPRSVRDSKGHKYYCRICNSTIGRKYYREVLKKHPERLQEKNRKQYLKVKSDPLELAKQRARYQARNAFKAGKIQRLPCFKCGSIKEPMVMHHPDYAKPLGVVWFCRKHHVELHDLAGGHKRILKELKVKKCLECNASKKIFIKDSCRKCYDRKYFMKRQLKKLEIISEEVKE